MPAARAQTRAPGPCPHTPPRSATSRTFLPPRSPQPRAPSRSHDPAGPPSPQPLREAHVPPPRPLPGLPEHQPGTPATRRHARNSPTPPLAPAATPRTPGRPAPQPLSPRPPGATRRRPAPPVAPPSRLDPPPHAAGSTCARTPRRLARPTRDCARPHPRRHAPPSRRSYWPQPATPRFRLCLQVLERLPLWQVLGAGCRVARSCTCPGHRGLPLRHSPSKVKTPGQYSANSLVKQIYPSAVQMLCFFCFAASLPHWMTVGLRGGLSSVFPKVKPQTAVSAVFLKNACDCNYVLIIYSNDLHLLEFRVM